MRETLALQWTFVSRCALASAARWLGTQSRVDRADSDQRSGLCSLKNGAKSPTDWRFQAALVVSLTPIAQLLSRPRPRKLAASSMIASLQCSLRAALIWLAVNLERIIALASKQRKSLFSECLPSTEIYADRRKAEVNQ